MPKPDPTEDEFSWRLSFSRGELILAENINTNPRLVYLAAKLFWKNNIVPVCSLLKSYHIKTLLYHFLEITSTHGSMEKMLQAGLFFGEKDQTRISRQKSN